MTAQKIMEGDFHTPGIWAEEGRKRISKCLGEDWKEKFVVYDPACGQGQLTREEVFSSLFCSTLHQHDLDENFNPEARKFLFNFLEESDQELFARCPEILEVFENKKPIIFLLNPPYATANVRGAKGEDKEGVSRTMIGEKMKTEGWGKASSQLYAQFLYRIFDLKKRFDHPEVHIAVYCPPLFLTGPSFYDFRKKFFDILAFQTGFLFQGSEFQQVKNDWAVGFFILSPGFSLSARMEVDVMKNRSGTVVRTGDHNLYNTDFGVVPAGEWVKSDTKGLVLHDAPQVSSALKVAQTGYCKLPEEALGYMLNKGNAVYENSTGVGLFSTSYANAHGVPVMKENLERVVALFAARKAVRFAEPWVHQKDEYLAPDDKASTAYPAAAWRRFVADAMVYSLFNNASGQSSMDGVMYKEKLCRVRNEFFWLPKKEAWMDWMSECEDGERHMSIVLKEHEPFFSPEGREVLEYANILFKASQPERESYADFNSDLHLNMWDAGYAQLKHLWEDSHPVLFEAFRAKYTKLEKSLGQRVYEVGFLKV